MKYYKYTLLSIAAFIVSFIAFNGFGTKTMTMDDFTLNKIKMKKERAILKNDQPDKAMLWYYEQRAYPLGYIPQEWRDEAYLHISKKNRAVNSSNALSWSQVGPGNIGGRIRAIAVNPTDPNTVYIGAVAGGVWKTVNGGASWTVLNDLMENLAVCALVIDPSNPNIIYAGTGEGYFNGDAIRGAGIFNSTDAGASWTRLSVTNTSTYWYVNDLEIDQTSGVLYAATRKGLYSSTDSGATFNPLIIAGGSDAHCMDIEIAYTDTVTIYATFGQVNQSAIWRSTDGGASFAQNLTQPGMGRIELTISKSNPLVAYASFLDLGTYGIADVKKTTDGGDNWNTIVIPGPSYAGDATYTRDQGWYDNILTVDPDDANILLVGGVDNWKTTDAGSSWTQTTNWYSWSGAPPYVHADQHKYAFAPSNSNIVYLGNDGGIWKSTDKGETWTSLNNNLFITQFYYGAVNPTGSVYAGGTQDNGTLRTTGSTNWTEILGGDGGATEIDFNNTNNIYMEYAHFAFFKSTDGGASFFKSMGGIPVGSNFWDGTTDRTLFISPFSMDPNNSNTLVAGTYRVWRTTNGGTNWSSISTDLTGAGTGSSGATISTVVVSKGNSNVIYVGCSNGRVQVTTDGGTNWNLRNTGLPSAYATRIATDPNNPAMAYVTYSGFSNGFKIYKTTDYGQTWANISGNLPNIPTNCVFVNPANGNNLYVGTDLGVFSTVDGGTSWVQDIAGMVNVPVVDLDYRSSDNKLFAATHGRSMFAAVVPATTSVDQLDNNVLDKFNVTQNYPNPFNPSTQLRYSIPQAENVRITVYDINGKTIATLINNFQSAGTYQVTWNGKNDLGQQVASGTYIYKVQAGDFVKTKKMVMLK